MPDLTPIQPIAAIIGALITATVASAVTYFIVVKRKSVVFFVEPSKTLTTQLRQHHDKISFKIGDREFSDLHRSSVAVRNTGNSAIRDFCFDVHVPGKHDNSLTRRGGFDDKLLEVIKSRKKESEDLVYEITVPFFNPQEAFEIEIFFDRDLADCDVRFRMEEVTWTVRTTNSIDIAFMSRREQIAKLLSEVVQSFK